MTPLTQAIDTGARLQQLGWTGIVLDIDCRPLLDPSKYDSFLEIYLESYDWCESLFPGKYHRVTPAYYLFEEASAAVLFKLTWGGK